MKGTERMGSYSRFPKCSPHPVEINEMLLLQLKENLEGGREGGKKREESKAKQRKAPFSSFFFF